MTSQRKMKIGDLITVYFTTGGVSGWVRKAYETQEPLLVIDIIKDRRRQNGIGYYKLLDLFGEIKYIRPRYAELMSAGEGK